MTKLYAHQLRTLFKRLSICFLIYFLCRLGLFIAQANSFEETGFLDLLLLSVYGLRFDAFSISVSNSLFVLLSLLPINPYFTKAYQKLLFWLFLLPNIVFTAFNCIDIVYFQFTHKRSDADLFNQLGGQSDMLRLIPRFFLDFWWAVLFFGILVYVMVFLYKRVAYDHRDRYVLQWSKSWWVIVVLFIFSAGVFVIAARGGLQRVPISLVNAGDVAKPAEIPLVVNTPFTIIKSSDAQALEELTFYSRSELANRYSPFHHFDSLQPNHKNLVVLILESFSKEYTRLGGKKSYTPFLDSLMQHSLVCTNGFSNGTKSIEGIPAILSGLPSLMDLPFINSRYAGNHQQSLANLLAKEGYQTAFFHGGINGTMNFDSWARLAGYQSYFGKNEYPDMNDFDNYWGIWDEPYLNYCAGQLGQLKEPFHASIFTLSSHHPYFVPEKYKNKFPKSELENTESIGYADYALGRFFEKAKKEKWYKNTLFVLVADHTSLSVDPYYIGPGGFLSIPVLFYEPDNSLAGEYRHVFSQVDILPTSLQMLGYNKPFFSLGLAAGNDVDRSSYFYYNNYFYQFTDSLLFLYKNYDLSHVYNLKRDSLGQANLKGNNASLENLYFSKFKAFVQTYNHVMIKDSTDATIDRFPSKTRSKP